MTYPTGPQIRDALVDALAMVDRIAATYHEEPHKPDQVGTGMAKAARLVRHRLIGDGAGCVIRALDPRRDDPEWQGLLAQLDTDPTP